MQVSTSPMEQTQGSGELLQSHAGDSFPLIVTVNDVPPFAVQYCTKSAQTVCAAAAIRGLMKPTVRRSIKTIKRKTGTLDL